MSGIIPITQHLDELEAAVAAEREACAKLVESLCANEVVGEENCWRFQHRALEQSAKAIRARGSVAATPPPSQKEVPVRGGVAGRQNDATAANVARLAGMLAQEKAEYDNASRQLDKALEELKAERRRGDALLASLEATVPKGQTWTPELQAGRLMRERDAARAEVERLSDRALSAESAVEDHKEARASAMRVVNQAWRDLSACTSRAEGLAAALRKIQNYTDETITCGWAREALEKFVGGEQ